MARSNTIIPLWAGEGAAEVGDDLFAKPNVAGVYVHNEWPLGIKVGQYRSLNKSSFQQNIWPF